MPVQAPAFLSFLAVWTLGRLHEPFPVYTVGSLFLTTESALFCAPGLPGCLSHAGNLTLVSEFTEADTADTVLAEISVGTSADFAAVVFTGGILLLFLLLKDH